MKQAKLLWQRIVLGGLTLAMVGQLLLAASIAPVPQGNSPEAAKMHAGMAGSHHHPKADGSDTDSAACLKWCLAGIGCTNMVLFAPMQMPNATVRLFETGPKMARVEQHWRGRSVGIELPPPRIS